jgi:hypothetical protein
MDESRVLNDAERVAKLEQELRALEDTVGFLIVTLPDNCLSAHDMERLLSRLGPRVVDRLVREGDD